MKNKQLEENIKIIQIYPFNNPVSKRNTKSVVFAGLPYITFSRYYDNILIISSFTNEPYNDKVIPINANNREDYYKQIATLLGDFKTIPPIIEVHQDVSLALFLAKKFQDKIKVSVIRHGSSLYRAFQDKIFFFRYFFNKFVLSRLEYVYCISQFTTNTLKKHYPKSASKFITIYNTYGHLKETTIDQLPSERDNIITFVGKPLRFKGIFIFIKAIKTYLSKYADWRAMIIGAKFSHKSKYGKVIKNLTSVTLNKENRLLLYEGIPIEEVFKKMLLSKIVVIPCIVKEPFCLVALEAHVAGCIVVSSGRGALKEVSGDYAYYLEDLRPSSLVSILEYIKNNPEAAQQKALLGREFALNKFNPKTLVTKLDNIRSKLLHKLDE